MKRLVGDGITLLEQMTKKGEPLTRDDLTFLYEIDRKIEGFGYVTDPRIKELREQRNPEEDILIIFDCAPAQIAHNESEITDATKVYAGALFKGIFQANIEHVFTTFPEGKLKRYNIEIGGKTKEDYVKALTEKNIQAGDYAKQLMESPEFVTLPTGEAIALVCLNLSELGFSSGATTDEIYKHAHELGLDLCPPEVGPALRLAINSPEWMRIGMKQITDRGSNPNVFSLCRDGGGLWLGTNAARPGAWWRAHDPFVFRARKLDAL